MVGFNPINRTTISLAAGIAAGSVIGLGAFSLASTATIALASAAALSLGLAIGCAAAAGLLSGIAVARVIRRALEPTSSNELPLENPAENTVPSDAHSAVIQTNTENNAEPKGAAPAIASKKSQGNLKGASQSAPQARLSPADFNATYPKVHAFNEKSLSSKRTLSSVQTGITLSWIKTRLKIDSAQGVNTSTGRLILKLGEHVQFGSFGNERSTLDMLDMLQLTAMRKRSISSIADVADWTSQSGDCGAVLWIQGPAEGTALGIIRKGNRVEFLDATQGTWSLASDKFGVFLTDYIGIFYPQYQATMLTPLQLG